MMYCKSSTANTRNRCLYGQTMVEFTLVAALVALAAAASIGPVKDAIDNQSKIAAQSISADGLETTAGAASYQPKGGKLPENVGAARDLRFWKSTRDNMNNPKGNNPQDPPVNQ